MSFNSKTDNKWWYNHLMENYTTKKMNEVFPHATSWMNLTKLSKQSQTEKNTYHIILFIKVQK